MDEKVEKIVWFEEIDKKDIPIVGGKGANLGEMTKAKIPVPPGFVVTAQTYFDFIDRAKLRDKMRAILEPVDPNNSDDLLRASEQVKQLITEAQMPTDIANDIKAAYRKLGDGLVAVRSSATAEDLPEASFAGQQRTFLNIEDEDEVVKAVQGCWASLFESRAIFYREHQGFDHFKVGIAVPVQKMVQSQSSGVMFTLEPVTSDTSKVVIEAVLGLGEAIVSGQVTPDLYVVDKDKLEIVDRRISRQEEQFIQGGKAQGDGETNIWVPVAEDLKATQKISDDNILRLARIGKAIEELYQFPQDIEWAQEGGELYIVQTRPVTAIKAAEAVEEKRIEAAVLLTGSAASPGTDAGPVKIVRGPSEIGKIEKGDVLVAEMTTPDYVPAMKRAVAIVTDRGGRTCHAAIVSRELGVPCVVGAGDATAKLTTGQIVTVDGSAGKVYEGRVSELITPKKQAVRRAKIKTRTRLYVNLAEPELADIVAERDVDGIGLLRAEFIVAQIGVHPRYAIAHNRQEEFINKLAEGMEMFARAFNPRPVIYRTTDFKTNEYSNLIGGKEYEEFEENPMLGYRGASRNITDVQSFQLEIEAIKRVRDKYKNLWVMIPFVRTVQEMAEARRILKEQGLPQSGDFKLWMMVEVPSNVLLLDKFIDTGIDGISIGSNDLTQLVLGIDRDNPRFAEQFDERNEAVMLALEMAVKTCVRRGITGSICGQAPSVYPELTEKLVEWGITSVSVSPDMIDQTRDIIAEVERKLGLTPE